MKTVLTSISIFASEFNNAEVKLELSVEGFNTWIVTHSGQYRSFKSEVEATSYFDEVFKRLSLLLMV